MDVLTGSPLHPVDPLSISKCALALLLLSGNRGVCFKSLSENHGMEGSDCVYLIRVL